MAWRGFGNYHEQTARIYERLTPEIVEKSWRQLRDKHWDPKRIASMFGVQRAELIRAMQALAGAAAYDMAVEGALEARGAVFGMADASHSDFYDNNSGRAA